MSIYHQQFIKTNQLIALHFEILDTVAREYVCNDAVDGTMTTIQIFHQYGRWFSQSRTSLYDIMKLAIDWLVLLMVVV